jgi:hypothetical protein
LQRDAWRRLRSCWRGNSNLAGLAIGEQQVKPELISLLSSVLRFPSAAEALGISDTGKRQILGIDKNSFHIAIEQA